MRLATAFVALAVFGLGSVGHAQTASQFSGELTRRAPASSFPLDLRAGQIVTLSTTSDSGLDTVLTIYGPDNRQIAFNDDAGGALTSQIVFVAPAAGRYRAEVTGYNNATGTFGLQVRDGADFGLSDVATVLREDRVSLSRRQTEVRFAVDLTADAPFVASTFALSEGLDTTLVLLDPDGEVLVENDDRGDGTLNSQIVYQPARAGRYTVVVSSYSGSDVGEAVVSLAADPEADAPFNFGSIDRAPFVRYDGQITNEQTEIDYPVELQAGQTILAMVEAGDDMLDPVLTIRDPNGLPVGLNDDRGDGTLNSAVAYTVPVSGVYVFNVARYAGGDSTGPFTLDISNVDAAVVDIVQGLMENPITLSGPELTIQTADFDLHYTLEGSDATTVEFAQLTADTLQRAYETQIGQLGWAAPIRDPDGRYRAYVADARDAMGYMNPVQTVFDNPSTQGVRESFAARGMLVIDNNLSEGREEQPEPLMHATAVHEFNHLVQFGYDAQEGLDWMYESSASWIEVATAGMDEDAARYAVTDFASPNLCWTTTEPGHDYGQWTLLQSLADSHGARIVPRLWDNAANHDGFETMSVTLGEVGDTIPQALARWRIQNFARDYDVASRIDAAVALAGSIKRNGRWSAGDDLQELGAGYVHLRDGGVRRYDLEGAPSLEMYGLGVRYGRVEVVPLGRGGVFDAEGYEYAALMVFNTAIPAEPGDCTDVDYAITVSSASDGASPVQYSLDASSFRRPES